MSCFLWGVQAAIFKMASQLPMGPVPSAGEFACIASEQVEWNDLTTEWTTEAVYNEGQWNNPISKKSAITFVHRSCFHTLSGFLEQCGVVKLFVVASLSELPSKPSFYKSASFVDNCNSYASKTSCRTFLLYLIDGVSSRMEPFIAYTWGNRDTKKPTDRAQPALSCTE